MHSNETNWRVSLRRVEGPERYFFFNIILQILFDTQNPGITVFSTEHAYKNKTKRQAKMRRDSRKMTFLLISHQATLVLEKHSFAHRPQPSEENRKPPCSVTQTI